MRTYTSKAGITGNIEQQIIPGIGWFARAGYTPGNLETYAFTDVDRTVATGASISGKFWGRSDDTVGIAGVVNMISKEHQAYLAAGGLTALIGDGHAAASRPRADHGNLLSAPGVLVAVDLRLSVHHQSRLQQGSRTGFGARDAAAYAVLARSVN